MKGDRRAGSCPGLSWVAPPSQGACFPYLLSGPFQGLLLVAHQQELGVCRPVRLENR